MQTAKPLSLTSIAILLLTLSAAALPALGQNSGVVVGGTRITHLVDDWSHHHVTFTNPGTADQAIKNGGYDKWVKVVNDPRYVLQQLKKGAPVQGPAASDVNYLYSHGHSSGLSSSTKTKITTSALDKDWSMDLGAGTLLINTFPAKFTFDATNPGGCGDFVVYPTGSAGTAAQATIVGYSSIYGATTCPSGPSDGGPNVSWAYNISGVTSALSPTISLDGTQVAFIGTSGGVASLIILNPGTGTGGTVTTPTALTPLTVGSSYANCTAPCALSLPFANGKTDTNSSPYYVYYGTNADAIFVGDDSGNLHRFTGVFNGTPAESITDGWPIALGTTKVTSPVLDPVTNLVFAGDAGGSLYAVTIGATTTSKATSARLAFNTSGIVDSPIVDVSGATSDVYVSVGCSATGCAGSSAVIQFPTGTSIAGAAGAVATLGSDATGTTQYDGAFDNTHEAGGGTTGYMYVCGYHTTGTAPEIFQIPMNSFAGTNTTIDTVTTGAAVCSPTTEFLSVKTPTTITAAMTTTSTTVTVAALGNIAVGDYIEIGTEAMAVTAIATGTKTLTLTRHSLGTTAATHTSGSAITDETDYMYLSVTALGSDTGCTGACLYNYAIGNSSASLTAGFALSSVTGLGATGGTSGIIIDNASTTTGEEQIYYATLGSQGCTGNGTSGNGTGRCAVQTSQAAP